VAQVSRPGNPRPKQGPGFWDFMLTAISSWPHTWRAVVLVTCPVAVWVLAVIVVVAVLLRAVHPCCASLPGPDDLTLSAGWAAHRMRTVVNPSPGTRITETEPAEMT
jgi:hypothetical protein